MDKSDLEEYQLQLSQVETALEADPDNAELASLRSELKQLIELTQTALAQTASSTTGSSASTTTALASSSTAGGSTGGGAAKGKGSGSSTPAHVWTAGDDCLAKYSGDNQWYPARITFIGGAPENRVYSIVFKGYNTTELVKANEIKPLPNNYVQNVVDSKKRKLTKEEEAERERKKKKNEKKLAMKAEKAKEQMEKQQTWQKFAKKSEKKGIAIAGVTGKSIFKTPDNPLGKGVFSGVIYFRRSADISLLRSGCNRQRQGYDGGTRKDKTQVRNPGRRRLVPLYKSLLEVRLPPPSLSNLLTFVIVSQRFGELSLGQPPPRTLSPKHFLFLYHCCLNNELHFDSQGHLQYSSSPGFFGQSPCSGYLVKHPIFLLLRPTLTMQT